MNFSRLNVLAWWLIGACFASCSSTPELTPARREGSGTLVVIAEGFESTEGRAWIALFLGPEGFPDEGAKAYRHANVPITGTTVSITFEDVPAGPFAISTFHDKNENDQLDKSFLGWPTEQWGVSRDAGGFMGPPSYADAELFLQAGATLEVRFPLG